MSKNEPLRPGSRTPRSGQYPILGPRGGATGQEVTSVEGRPLPPTPKPGQVYAQVSVTDPSIDAALGCL